MFILQDMSSLKMEAGRSRKSDRKRKQEGRSGHGKRREENTLLVSLFLVTVVSISISHRYLGSQGLNSGVVLVHLCPWEHSPPSSLHQPPASDSHRQQLCSTFLLLQAFGILSLDVILGFCSLPIRAPWCCP